MYSNKLGQFHCRHLARYLKVPVYKAGFSYTNM